MMTVPFANVPFFLLGVAAAFALAAGLTDEGFEWPLLFMSIT